MRIVDLGAIPKVFAPSIYVLEKIFPSFRPDTEGAKRNKKQLLSSGDSEEVFMEEHITQGSPPPAAKECKHLQTSAFFTWYYVRNTYPPSGIQPVKIPGAVT